MIVGSLSSSDGGPGRVPDSAKFPSAAGMSAAEIAARLFALAVGGNVRGERKHLLVSTVPRDQVSEPISPCASAFRALDAEQVELADQVGKDGRAVAGACGLFHGYANCTPATSRSDDVGL